MAEDSGSLFATESAKRRSGYKFYGASMVVGVCLIWFYRATHVPEEGRWAWMGMLGAEIWFGFYWFITQSVRWNPIYRTTFKDKLSQRFGAELPGVDVFVCTADPSAEPPTMVISTILSLMSYDYPPEKLSLYLSDDAGSELTFYALWQASRFAKHWLPFCKRYNVEPRSPAAYFSRSHDAFDIQNPEEWASMKNLYEKMVNHIDYVIAQGKIPTELKGHKGFSEWDVGLTSGNHQSIVQLCAVYIAECNSQGISGSHRIAIVRLSERRSLATYRAAYFVGRVASLDRSRVNAVWGFSPLQHTLEQQKGY